jgi:small subunit ribosomal protein S17
MATTNTNTNTDTVRLRKQLTGIVISDKMDKTVIVRADRRMVHPIYEKVVTISKKFAAHDEKNEAKVGDQVRIRQSRPLSKTKRWVVIETIRKAAQEAKPLKASAEKVAATAKAKAKTKAAVKRKKK